VLPRRKLPCAVDFSTGGVPVGMGGGGCGGDLAEA
jgi:hypothetical protein